MAQQQLLTKSQTASLFGMAPATFARHRAALVAQGLRIVFLNAGQNKPRFTEGSINALIAKAEQRGTLL